MLSSLSARRRNTHHVDTTGYDPEHDLDLVAMLNNARSEYEIRQIAQLSRARMKARRSDGNGRTAARRAGFARRALRLSA